MHPGEGLTDDQLRAAFAAVAPPIDLTFEQTKRAALEWSRVCMHARLVARGVRLVAPIEPPAVAPAPTAAAPSLWGSLRAPTRPLPLDGKSAAAGERAED